VIKLVNCGYCGIENMAIFGNSNPDHRPSACIASFRDATVPQSVRGTHGNFFSNLVLGGIQSTMVYYGIAYDYSGLDANNDTGYHENIEIDNHTESGVYMRGTQCRPHMFINCVVQGGTHGYFDGENSIGAQFAWIGGTVVNTTVSAFELHGGTDGGIITILGVTAENNRRFLTQSGIGNAHAVTIRDCNMGNDLSVSLPDDGEWIKYFAAGPLIIDGCHIGYSQGIDDPMPKIGIYYGVRSDIPETAALDGPPSITITNNVFDQGSSYKADPVHVSSSVPILITRHGNIGKRGAAPWDLPGEPPMQIDTYALVPFAPVMPIPAHNAGVFEIVPTNCNPFTIGNPESAPGDPSQAVPPSHVHHSSGRTIVIKIKNTGTMGPATWESRYKLAPWVQPALGFQRSITFRTLDGTLWYEESRTADIPN
jgi:hypothetical protein